MSGCPAVGACTTPPRSVIRRAAWPAVVTAGLGAPAMPTGPVTRPSPPPRPWGARHDPVHSSAQLLTAPPGTARIACIDEQGSGGRALAAIRQPVADVVAPLQLPMGVARGKSRTGALGLPLSGGAAGIPPEDSPGGLPWGSSGTGRGGGVGSCGSCCVISGIQ